MLALEIETHRNGVSIGVAPRTLAALSKKSAPAKTELARVAMLPLHMIVDQLVQDEPTP